MANNSTPTKFHVAPWRALMPLAALTVLLSDLYNVWQLPMYSVSILLGAYLLWLVTMPLFEIKGDVLRKRLLFRWQTIQVSEIAGLEFKRKSGVIRVARSSGRKTSINLHVGVLARSERQRLLNSLQSMRTIAAFA